MRNERIEKLWFVDGLICILTSNGAEYRQPLEAFPALFYASESERNKYSLWQNGRSVRWEEIDEDIHISNFFETETVNLDNEVNELFVKFPWLDMKAFANYLDMHWTKLARFRFGIWTPSKETMTRIKEGIRAIGREMSAAVL